LPSSVSQSAQEILHLLPGRAQLLLRRLLVPPPPQSRSHAITRGAVF
jgi:hypothetical protein